MNWDKDRQGVSGTEGSQSANFRLQVYVMRFITFLSCVVGVERREEGRIWARHAGYHLFWIPNAKKSIKTVDFPVVAIRKSFMVRVGNNGDNWKKAYFSTLPKMRFLQIQFMSFAICDLK